MTRRIVRFLTAGAVAGLLIPGMARAEDTKGKWQFGFGISYFATSDYIRSNSDLAFVTTQATGGGLDAVGVVDERPDINMLNQPSIADDFKIDFSSSYGLTRWLALELAGSYQKSAVGNIEYFTVDNTRQPLPSARGAGFSGCGPNADAFADCQNYGSISDQPEVKTNSFLPIGQITKIPIQFSGLVRFRPESPLDPYVGLGVGYTLASLDRSARFDQRAREVSQLQVRSAWEGEFTNVVSQATRLPAAGSASFAPGPLQATVKNSFEWHAVGGVDYYLNDHFSFYVDARYIWTSGQVNITTDGAHQVLFSMVDEGQLLLKKQMTDPSDPNSTQYLWEDKLGLWNPNPITAEGQTRPLLDCTVTLPGGLTKSCTGDGLFETEDKNQNGNLDYVQNGAAEDEDNGVLYVFAPGPIRDVNDRITNITAHCDACVGNEPYPGAGVAVRPDSEDHNYNFYMDRFLMYGIDFCSTPESVGSVVCSKPGTQQWAPGTAIRYVFPEGCPQTVNTQFGPSLVPEGCPPPPPPAVGSQEPKVLTGTANDNAGDTLLIQGGRIRLGGFSLGLGFKFTF